MERNLADSSPVLQIGFIKSESTGGEAGAEAGRKMVVA